MDLESKVDKCLFNPLVALLLAGKERVGCQVHLLSFGRKNYGIFEILPVQLDHVMR